MKRKVIAILLAAAMLLSWSIPAGAADKPAAEAARLYRGVLSGITVPADTPKPVTFYDVCGDSLPEMIVLANGRPAKELQVWTVQGGQAVKALSIEWWPVSVPHYYLYRTSDGRLGCLYTNSGTSPESVLRTREGTWYAPNADGTLEAADTYTYWYREFRDGTHSFVQATVNGGSASEREAQAQDAAMTSGLLLMDLEGNGYQGRSKSDAMSYLYSITGAFFDVPSIQFYATPVEWAVEQGITTGTGTYTFSPGRGCTRGEAVTFLWRAAGSPQVTAGTAFTDVNTTDFFAPAVAWAVAKGITYGTGNGKFSPYATCTRGQIVTFLHRAAGSPASSGGASFSDVPADQYYARAVAWAVEKGITNGTGGGRFSPDATCTRGEIVTFLYRARDLQPEPGEGDWSKAYETFVTKQQFLLRTEQEYNYDAGFFSVALYDLDRDGTPELIIGNGAEGRALRAAYCYTYTGGEIRYLGIAPTEAYYHPTERVGIYGRYSDSGTENWTKYTKAGGQILRESAGEYPLWQGHPELVLLPSSTSNIIQATGWEAFLASQPQ